MRVVAGSAKGHKLKAVPGLSTRPTQDRVKESIFNIIMNHIEDQDTIDLFGGTGNLGIEALSRGAKSAIFVDKNPVSVNIIKENLAHTKLSEKAKVICSDVLAAIPKLKGSKFGLIFMDPPYNKGFIIPVLEKIFETSLLSEDGVIVAEREKKDELSGIPFDIAKEREYGDTVVSFLVHKQKE